MERDRAWRRHIEEKQVKKRITRLSNKTKSYWRFLEDVNGFNFQFPKLKDYIGRIENFMFKNYTTDKYLSRNKVKFSPNKNKPYFRDGRKKLSTREYKKREFLKILKENEIK
jgi:hypothetical protein